MNETVIRVLLALVAVVNVLPVVGALSADRLRALYGVVIDSPDLVVLLRHRAVLFAIVAGLLAAAVFRPELRMAAAAAGFASMLSFVGIAWLGGPVAPALQRVVVVDLGASAALSVAVFLHVRG